MSELFGSYSETAWTVILALLLYYPVRQLIWTLSVRRAERRDGSTDDKHRQALKRRAGFTAALLSFVFAYFYTAALMPGP